MLARIVLAVVAFILIRCAIAYYGGWQFDRKAARLGCKPAAPAPRLDAWWDVLGIASFRNLLKARSEGKIIDLIINGFDNASEQNGRHVTLLKTSTIVGENVITRDPKIIQTILATSFNDFELGTSRVDSFHALLGTGIFSSNGAQWSHARTLLKPAFNKSQVSDLDFEDRHSKNLMLALPVNKEGWTEQVDLQPLFFRLTMDSSTELLFGESVLSQLHELPEKYKPAGLQQPKTKEERFFASAFDNAQMNLAKKSLFRTYHWLYRPSGYKEACDNCHRFVDNFVQLALKKDFKAKDDPEKGGGKTRYVFLEELAKETRDPIQIRDQLISILLAGRDTTASLLSFLFSILARRPDMFQRLRTAILEDFGTPSEKREISFSSLKSCRYLQYYLSETLRLYPAVPVNSRQASVDTVLPCGGGPDGLSPVFIPAGMDVMYSVAVMHRDKTLWGEDANEFKPERWAGRSSTWAFLPFNGGPRICLGQQLSLTTAGYATVRLLQRFDRIDNLDPEEISLHLTLTACPRTGVKVKLHEAAYA